MKQVVFGGMMIIAGMISAAILMTSVVPTSPMLGPSWFFLFSRLRHYQLIVPFIISVISVGLGFSLGLWGLLEKEK